MSTININTPTIPDWARYALLRSAYNDLQKFFDQPGTKERFQEWKKQRETQKGVNE